MDAQKAGNLEALRPAQEVSVVPCTLKYHRHQLTFDLPRDQVFKLVPGHMVPVTINLSTADQEKWKSPEFIVFQVRITEFFEVEQVGSGFPCDTAAKAKEVAQLIDSKNLPVPMVTLISWSGGFAVATMTNREAWYDELVLFHYHQPQKISEQWSQFSLRHFKKCVGRPPEMVKEEMLLTTDPQVAQELFLQKHLQLKAGEAARRKPQDVAALNTNEAVALRESQLIVLSKAFPETVWFMRNGHGGKPRDVYAAYQRDMFTLTGKMFEPLTFNQEQFWKAVTSFKNRRRNRKKDRGIDPLEYELVTGWFFRGYGKMTPNNRVAALKARGFRQIPSSEAIRKICTKLKLPSLRKPGHH